VVHDALPFLAAALAGGMLGWLVCAIVLRREHESPTDRRDEERLAASVLDRSGTGYLVVDSIGHQRLANPATEALGLAHLGLPEPAILELAARATQTGEPQAAELPGRGIGVDAVLVVAEDIGSGLVLVVGTDQSAARRTEAMRRDFVANVSHELKTPVTAINLLAEALQGGADDPATVRAFADRLHRESTRLGTMVTELIALSAVQGAGLLASPEPVEIDDVIADAIDRASVPARTAHISLTADAPIGLVVSGDRSLLITAVTNLVENAVHYSPPNSAVSVSRMVRGDRVEIAVTDRGIGIAPEHQQRVFERFFRVDPARSRATGGTGLGLSIVKHVAATHSGTVTLWSRVGVGSTFTLSLPLSAQIAGDVGQGSHPSADSVPAEPPEPPAQALPTESASAEPAAAESGQNSFYERTSSPKVAGVGLEQTGVS
jgi:two-component system sensor histidine kinase SenX3